MFSFISMAFREGEEIPRNVYDFLNHDGMKKSISLIVASTVMDNPTVSDFDDTLSRLLSMVIANAIHEFRCNSLILDSGLGEYFDEMMEEANKNEEIYSSFVNMFESFSKTLDYGLRYSMIKTMENSNSQWRYHSNSDNPPMLWENMIRVYSDYERATLNVLQVAFKLFTSLGFAYGKYRSSSDVLAYVEEPDPIFMDTYISEIKELVFEILSDEEDGHSSLLDSGIKIDTSAFDDFILSDLDISKLEDDEDDKQS